MQCIKYFLKGHIFKIKFKESSFFLQKSFSQNSNQKFTFTKKFNLQTFLQFKPALMQQHPLKPTTSTISSEINSNELEHVSK